VGTSAAGRRVTLDDLGAWLVKGNADQADLAGRFREDPRVTTWCVQPTYRIHLIRAGQPVLFWASGSRSRATTYGIWGLGHTTGPAHEEAHGWSIPLDLVIAEPADRVSREELRHDPALHDLEVLRLPVGANPSFVSVEQFTAVRRYLSR